MKKIAHSAIPRLHSCKSWRQVCQYALLWLMFSLPFFGQAQDKALFKEYKAVWNNTQASDADRLQAAKDMLASFELGNDSLRTLSQEILTLGKRKQSPTWLATGHFGMGNYYYRLGIPDSARIAYQHGINQLKDNPDELLIQLYASAALVFSGEGQRDSSLHYLLQALDLVNRYGYTLAVPELYVNLGAHYHEEGAYMEALAYYGKAKHTDDYYAALNAAMNMGFIFESLGLKDEARAEYMDALALAKQTKNWEAKVQIYSTAMNVAPSLAAMQALLDEGLALADSIAVVRPSFYILLEGGILYLDSLQLDKADYYLHEAMDLAVSLNDTDFKYQALLPLAKLDYVRGDYATALKRSRELQPVLESAQAFDPLIALYGLMSQTFEALSRPDSALHYLHQKEKLEAQLDDTDQAKDLLSAYLKNKTEQETLALKLAKENAEAQAGKALAQKQLTEGFVGVLVFVLLATLAFFYLYYRQKRISEERLRAINTNLALQTYNLQYSNGKLERFARVISHDILANLDLVLSSGNILVEDAALEPPFAKYYDITRRTVGKLKDYSLNLLRDTLTLTDDAATHDPMPVVKAILESYEPLLTERRFRLEISDLPKVGVPMAVIEQLFQNLISNVIRHAGQGAVPLLRIASQQQGNQTAWIIEDNGPGVPPAQRTTIFEHNPSSASAIGNHIGLSLLKQTLLDYDASIAVTDRPGGGARFVVAFQ